jgi:hypothetical protein
MVAMAARSGWRMSGIDMVPDSAVSSCTITSGSADATT